MLSSSKGVHISPGSSTQVISIMMDIRYKFGSILLTFTEDVALVYSAALLNIQWSRRILPLNALGTEYFIVLPYIDATDYMARVCSTHDNTDATFEITDLDGIVRNGKEFWHSDIHETIEIHRLFNFSGTRILSSYDVAIFCSFYDEHDISNIPLNLPPSAVFGNTYHIVNYCKLSSTGRLYQNIEIIAIHNNTTVVFSDGNFSMSYRGQLMTFYDIVKSVSSFRSEKKFAVTSTCFGEGKTFFAINNPTNRYHENRFWSVSAKLKLIALELIYSTLCDDHMNITVLITGQRSWELQTVEFTYENVVNTSEVMVGRLDIEHNFQEDFYIYIHNMYPLEAQGVLIGLQGVAFWWIPWTLYKPQVVSTFLLSGETTYRSSSS